MSDKCVSIRQISEPQTVNWSLQIFSYSDLLNGVSDPEVKLFKAAPLPEAALGKQDWLHFCKIQPLLFCSCVYKPSHFF